MYCILHDSTLFLKNATNVARHFVLVNFRQALNFHWILQYQNLAIVQRGFSFWRRECIFTHAQCKNRKEEKKILFSNKKILPLTSNSLTTFPESVLGPGNYPWYLSSWVWIASAEQVQKILGYVVYSFRINIATKLW